MEREKDKAYLAAAFACLAFSLVFALSLHSGSASASITGAATTGTGSVQVMVIDEVVSALRGGGGGRGISGICAQTCEFGATRCDGKNVNICVPIFRDSTVCGVWMIVECHPGAECSEGRCTDCDPDWQPFPWSNCSDKGIQFRTSVDYNRCYDDIIEKTEYRECDPSPTCLDKVQNQGEEGVDCGGPCKPCEYPAAVSPPKEAPKKPMYTCGDNSCGALEFCWQDCRTKMAAIPAALVLMLSLLYVVPFLLMNMGGDYSLHYLLKKIMKKIESGKFAAGNRAFMTKAEPRFLRFMARYNSGKKRHTAIESLYSEAKMYLQTHEADLSMKLNDKEKFKEAMGKVNKLSSRFREQKPMSGKAYSRFMETSDSLKSFAKPAKAARKRRK